MKIRQRLALRFTLVSSLISGAILITIYFLTLQFVHDDFSDRLSQQCRLEILHFASPEVKDVMPTGAFNLVNPATSIFLKDKKLVYKSGDYEIPSVWVEILINERVFHREVGEYTIVGGTHSVNDIAYYVFVSDKDLPGQREMDFLEQAALMGWIIGLLLSYIAGYYFSSQALKPMTSVVEDVNKITENNLSYRLNPDKGSGSPQTIDEIDELVITFNALLSRIQTAFIGQKRFVQNASHELKTPLTSIMAQVELGLSRTRTVEEYQRTLKVILHETERLANIIHGFLTLARLEEGTAHISMTPTSLDLVINDTISTFKLHHPDRKVAVTGSFYELLISGNQHLLQSAFLNLLDNAAKYSKEKIEISLRMADQKVSITIRDYGLGIPKADLSRIRDTMFRASNVSTIPGVGLGLPLVEKIVHLHGGHLDITSEEGKGTECTVRFFIKATQQTMAKIIS